MIVMGLEDKMVMANIQNLNKAIDKGVPKAVLDSAMEVMRLSQFEVPHDEGTLQNSGTVEVMPSGNVVLGYHTPYAARLHEHPEYRFQKGRKGKYITDPIRENADAIGIHIGRGFGKIVGEVL